MLFSANLCIQSICAESFSLSVSGMFPESMASGADVTNQTQTQSLLTPPPSLTLQQRLPPLRVQSSLLA